MGNPMREKIATFLEAPLPADFKVADSDDVRLLDREQIEKLVLERPPFFFIEKAVAVNGKTVLGSCTMSEERSAGHFPDRPIVPLIELCKATAQVSIILAALQGSENEAPVAISSGPSKALAKDLIEAPVRLLIKAELTSSRMRLHFVSGINYVDGVAVGSLKDVIYTLINRQQLLRKR